MNALDTLADQTVRVEYCDTGTANKMRAWARRNRAIAVLVPHARGALSGHVTIRSRWNEGAQVARDKRAAFIAAFGSTWCR